MHSNVRCPCAPPFFPDTSHYTEAPACHPLFGPPSLLILIYPPGLITTVAHFAFAELNVRSLQPHSTPVAFPVWYLPFRDMSIFTRLALLVCALGAANAVDILVIGDSYAEYGKTYWASFCGATARNEGSGGTTSVQWANGDTMQDAFDTAPEAKHILYLIGGNDFMGAKCAPTRVEMKATVLKSLNILVAAVAAAGKGAEEREREEEEVEGEREAEPNCVCVKCVCVCAV